MKANEFFNDMRKTARAWDKTSDFPYTSGAMKALNAWGVKHWLRRERA